MINFKFNYYQRVVPLLLSDIGEPELLELKKRLDLVQNHDINGIVDINKSIKKITRRANIT